MRRAVATVTGRVQGVGFRWFVVQAATGLGLSGHVRNLRGGAVEVIAEGPAAEVERLLGQLHGGPPGARVEEVVVEWRAATGEFPSFGVAS